MTKKTIKLLLFILFFSFVLSYAHCNEKDNQEIRNIPNEGFVPDELTAIKIAEIILIRIYGDEIKKQSPFSVELIQDSTIWVVQGSNHGIEGGVAEILIRKSDCKIINVTHGK